MNPNRAFRSYFVRIVRAYILRAHAVVPDLLYRTGSINGEYVTYSRRFPV